MTINGCYRPIVTHLRYLNADNFFHAMSDKMLERHLPSSPGM